MKKGRVNRTGFPALWAFLESKVYNLGPFKVRFFGTAPPPVTPPPASTPGHPTPS